MKATYTELYLAQRAIKTFLKIGLVGDPATALGLVRLGEVIGSWMGTLAKVIQQIDEQGLEQEERNKQVEEAMNLTVEDEFPTVHGELLQKALERAYLRRTVLATASGEEVLADDDLMGSTPEAVQALLPFLR